MSHYVEETVGRKRVSNLGVTIDCGGVLVCPRCGSPDGYNTHQESVDVHGEINVSVGEFPLPDDPRGDWSQRFCDVAVHSHHEGGNGSGIVVGLWCEHCGERFYLHIVQHKGETQLSCSYAEDVKERKSVVIP